MTTRPWSARPRACACARSISTRTRASARAKPERFEKKKAAPRGVAFFVGPKQGADRRPRGFREGAKKNHLRIASDFTEANSESIGIDSGVEFERPRKNAKP